MSLRFRLFALFGGLLALLVAAELWLVRSLTERLSVQVGEVATSVGRRMVRVIASGPGGEAPGHLPVPVPRDVAVLAPGVAGDAKKPHFFVYRTESKTTKSADGQERVETEVRVEASDATVPGGRVTRVLKVHGPNVDTTIPIPEGDLGRTVEVFRKRLLLGSLGILGLGLLVAAVVAHRVSSPLRELSDAARRVGEGGLGARVEGRAGGEVGEAIEAFNRMSGRLAELERQALLGKEREHLGELGDVARGLAHALRNPLHAIGLSLDELAARAEGEEATLLAETARRQIRRVDESIRSFLALASGGSGAVETLDAAGLVEDVVLSALQDARGRVRIDVEKPAGPLGMRGIPAEVRAVVQALVVNAVEASPDGAAVRVRVAADGPGAVVVTVEDEGMGIAEEVRDRLFLPHVTTKANGSGMGLFLAQRIAATRYAGSVSLERAATGRAPRGPAGAGGGEPKGTRATLRLRDREGANAA